MTRLAGREHDVGVGLPPAIRKDLDLVLAAVAGWRPRGRVATSDPVDLGDLLRPGALPEHDSALVLERYGSEHGPDSTLISWSVAKSILHTLVGLLVRDGKLSKSTRADRK